MLKRLLLSCLMTLVAVAAFAQTIRVSDIQIEGNDRIATSAILAAVQLDAGTDITMDAVDSALRRIYKIGSFEDVSAQLTEVQGAKIVTFVVSELPLVRRINFKGNDELKEEKLRPLLKMRTPSILSQNKIDKSIEELKKAYIEDGFHAVKITTDVKIDINNEATLEFVINEGEKVLIKELRFVGNTVFDKDDLIDKIETREKWWLSWLTGRGAYQEDIMDIDLERIKAAYQDVGYQDVKVAPAQVDLVDDEYLDVLIEIDEGPLYHVGTIDVSGDLMRDKDDLFALLTLKTGDVFSRSELRNSVLALTDLYADNGYAYANVSPLPDKNVETYIINLNLDIDQGRQIYVEKIVVHGNTKTRDKVIRREIPIAEGELYSASKIKAANRSIRNLGFFDEVNLIDKPGSDPSQAILDVSVSEKPTGTFSIGMGYSSVEKVIAQGSISQENLFGYGIKLNLSGSMSASSVTYSLGLSDPHFLDTDWTAGIELYKSEHEYSSYDDYRTGAAIRAGHPITEKSKLYLTYRYEIQEILNIDDDVTSPIILAAEGESVLSSITTEWVRNSTNNYQDPSRGGITRLSVEYGGLGGDQNFVKPILDHRHFFPMFWHTVFSIHGSIGYVGRTNGEEVPLGEKFFLGGIKTLRGFESREVGPQDSTGEYIGGEKMAYFNFEYIFPIDRDLGLKGLFFYDTGNAWLDRDDYFTDMRHSAGAGIRWLSPLGPLRFEWGYNLDRYPGEAASVFEFSIGRAF